MWILIVEMWICAGPNHRKVTKAEHGRSIPRKLTANLEPSTLGKGNVDSLA